MAVTARVTGEEDQAASDGGHQPGRLAGAEGGGGEHKNWTSGLEKALTTTGLLGHSDSSFDAWLTAAAAQVPLSLEH